MASFHSSGAPLSRLMGESNDDYWIIPAPVQYGLRKITCLFRFETSTVSFANEVKIELGMNTCRRSRPVYTMWVSSREDPSLLYSCRMDSADDALCIRYTSRTPSILKSLIEGANLPFADPKNTMINLIGENEVGLFVRLSNCSSDGDTPSAVRLALNTPSGTQWKAHLLAFIEALRSDLRKEKWKRELLEKDAISMKNQLAQMERNRGWQEKELEMLYTMIQQQPSSSTSHDEPGEQPEVSECSEMSEPAEVRERSSSTDSVELQPLAVASSNKHMTEKSSRRGKEGLANDDLLLGVVSQLLCSICPDEVTLTDQDCMREHFISRHLDDEKGKCRACPEVSSSRVDPVSHMKVHLSRVYACEYCGKKGRKHYLKAHIRTHTGEKPFTCQICARSFADSSTFRRHQMVHTGEKKHACPICGRCIARKDNVKTHIRSHARNLPLNSNFTSLTDGILAAAVNPKP